MPRDFTNDLRRKLSERMTMDDALAELRKSGASKVECIVAVQKVRQCSLGEAKEIVHVSSAWADLRVEHDGFHAESEQAMQEWTAGADMDEETVAIVYRTPIPPEEQELNAVFGTDGFRRAFPGTRFLSSPEEMMATQKVNGLPGKLMPFMITEEMSGPDIYALEHRTPGEEARVVVWAGDAIVKEWASFLEFKRWVNEQVRKHDKES